VDKVILLQKKILAAGPTGEVLCSDAFRRLFGSQQEGGVR